ncbi:uncharacterized protein [Antedon mediterranea]|uniref:uncharacterized protein n=1 Tax=Antedon mediterranea TaxID=105859 RepID=UPI003AF6A964
MPKRKPLDKNFVRRHSSRTIRVPQKFDAAPVKHECNYWSLSQKQSLLKTLTTFSKQYQQLRKLSPTHLKTLQKSIKTKSIENIEAYIESLTRIKTEKNTEVENAEDDPQLQPWVELLEDQAEATGLDCSSQISKMLSTASRDKHGSFSTDPDFKRLYQWIDALVQDKTLPELSNIDALIILDCMENLEMFINDVDTTEQKNLMIEKSDKLKEFLYSNEDYVVTTEMCDEIDQNEDIRPRKKKKSKISIASSTTAIASKNKITMSMSSLNPFGVPPDMLNFKQGHETV